MARWGKLFSSKGKSRDYSSQPCPESKTEWFLPAFDKSQIRLLLFQDHELRGRPLLLDSQTVRKIEPRPQQSKMPEAAPKPKSLWSCKKPPRVPTISPSTAPVSTTNGSPDMPKYQFNSHHSSPDVHLLGEMVFGTAALSYKGPSLKVHTLKCPQQLLISTVFIPSCKTSRGANNISDGECPTVDPLMGPASLSEATGPRDIAGAGTVQQKPEIAHSLPMDVPKTNSAGACQARDHDSGFSNSSLTSSGSWQQVSFPPSPGSSCSLNSNSCNSLQRRWRRSVQCSLDHGVPKPQPRYNYDDMSTSSVEPVPARLRHARVGMGVLFKEYDEEAAQRMQEFFFSHVTLVEGRMNKLRLVVEAARVAKTNTNWQVTVMEAFEEFQQEIYDLYTAPRLPNPVWLDMMALALHRRMLCDAFMKEFSGLIDKYDTKHTNFFLSTLLTATLTYHLSWVPTVIPAGVTTSRTYYSDKHTAKWLDLLTRSHPYNPLWAQLSDLCGAIGSPLRLARTVVVGKKAEVVRRFLYMLSYFIRCTEIHENAEEYTEQDYAVVGSCAAVESALASGGGGSRGGSDSAARVVELHSFESVMSTTDCAAATAGCWSSAQTSSSDSASLRGSWHQTAAAADSLAIAAATVDATSGALAGTPLGATATSSVPSSSTADKVAHWMSSCVETCDSSGSLGSCAAAVAAQDSSIEGPSGGGGGGGGTSAGGVRCVLAEHGPLTAKRENVRALGREAPTACALGREAPLSAITQAVKDDQAAMTKYQNALPPPQQQAQPSLSSREQLRRLFSQEVDEFDVYFDLPEDQTFGRPVVAAPSTGGGLTSPTAVATAAPGCSIFDEYFDEGCNVPIGLLSLHSQQQQQAAVAAGSSASCCRHLQQCASCGGCSCAPPSLADADGGCQRARHLLLKVPKPSGFLNWSQQQPPPPPADCRQTPADAGSESNARRSSSSAAASSAIACCRQPSGSGSSACDEGSSSACGTPQTLRCTTPNIISVDSGLGPKRHASGGSAVPVEINETFCKYVEVPMPRSRTTRSCSRSGVDLMSSAPIQTAANFGRSQLAGYSDHYLSDFVLHGTSDTQFERKLQSDLDLAVQFPILDEPVTEAACIIANTDTWVVQVASSMKTTDEKKSIMTAPLVVNMVESVQSLYKQKMSSEFCMMHLEDTLREMYFKSRMLAEYVNSQKKVNMDDLSAMLGFDISDLPLLLSVAATHSTLLTDGLY